LRQLDEYLFLKRQEKISSESLLLAEHKDLIQESIMQLPRLNITEK
jgi:hypothetical protein